MRRIAAALLLLLVGILPLQPLVLHAQQQASIPACCRVHGAHHCMMQMAAGADTSRAWVAPPCPYSHIHHAVMTAPVWMHIAVGKELYTAVSQSVSRGLLHSPASFRHFHRTPRGPPTNSL